MARPIKNVMVDIETLATEGERAAIMQVGAAFMLAGDLVTRELDISPKCYITEEDRELFTISEGTVAFHRKTNMANLTKCAGSANDYKVIPWILRDWITEATEGGAYTIKVWCCGTDFDVPKLAYVFKLCDVKPNWAYNRVADYRTLRDLYKEEVPLLTKNCHTAASDAKNQHQHLAQIMAFLGKEFY